MSIRQNGSFDMYAEVRAFEPPEPNEEGLLPRFIIEDQPFIHSTYGFVQDRLQQLIADDPALVGATVFGSTTKGYARPGTSDLDLTVFVDAERLGLKPGIKKVLTGEADEFGDWVSFYPEDHDYSTEYYEKTLQKRLTPADGAEMEAELMIQPQVYPISTAYMRLLAAHEVSRARKHWRYQELRTEQVNNPTEELADWSSISNSEVVLRSLPGIAKAIAAAGIEPIRVDWWRVQQFLGCQATPEDGELSGLRQEVFWANRQGSSLPMRLFNLAITPGLDQYRRTFLRGLAKAEQPDHAWTFFCRRLAKFEDAEKWPRDTTKIMYPKTLAEAREIYG